VLAVSWQFQVAPQQNVTKLVVLAYDDIYSIDFFGQKLRAYWRRNSPDDSFLASISLLERLFSIRNALSYP
jgi:hypothetical protein